MKRHFDLQAKVAHYAFKHLTNECMKLFCSGLNKVAEIEQNLALGKDADDKEIPNPLPDILYLLKSEEYSRRQKIRVLFLYLFYQKGISAKRFEDLIMDTGLNVDDVSVFYNMAHLGVDVFNCNTDYFPSSSKVIDPPSYTMSRWTPMIKGIMQKCITGTLSEKTFPFLDKPLDDVLAPRPSYWCSDKKSAKLSKLVVFFAGGVTYSEMRAAYEVMAQYGGWEVIIGSDCILTPKLFLEKLQQLPHIPLKESGMEKES